VNRILGVKSYGFEWHLRYGLTEAQVARAMVRQGIDWVAAQNLRDPLPTSAVRQDLPGPPYDDRRLRDALRAAGLRIFEATAVFFRPAASDGRPDLRPIDAEGQTMEPFGWYVGLCPSSPDYLAERAALIEEVVASLQPDGVFLSFIRFPGFWELWMPETTRAEIAEYCFCERCLQQFQAETGHLLPEGATTARARVLQRELRNAWTDWKCGLIASVVETLGAAARRGRPDVEVLVNGIALGRDDYGNAVEEVLGQRLEALSGPADHVELMFYHQILRREPTAWIASLTAAARPRTRGTLLACLQARADYLGPIYRAGRRRSDIPLDEFTAALRAVAESPADGAMLYHWLDVLEDDMTGDGAMASALRAFKDGSLSGGGRSPSAAPSAG
jgi:hypothetical protein